MTVSVILLAKISRSSCWQKYQVEKSTSSRFLDINLSDDIGHHGIERASIDPNFTLKKMQTSHLDAP